jgi:cellulose synthase/poly-beta-1,6-N-acetylglucosamine synthase-like glycosyltransferase
MADLPCSASFVRVPDANAASSANGSRDPASNHNLKKGTKTMLANLKVVLGGLAAVTVLVLFPVLHAVVLGVNLLIHLLVLGWQVVATRLPIRRPATRALPEEEPFVSIHVPAHNEPPSLLIETLQSLSRLKWSNYEVLVIDNNTADESLWRPVEAACRELGPRFRFLHVEGITGAKAGAMNWARKFMDPRAEFIFVVDADYLVERHALKRALAHCTGEDVALVQFPQDYRNVNRANRGLALDYRHFFAGYMNLANRLGCVPSTGTLTLIRVSALRAVGGFDEQIVTEDAELGLRLNLAGHRTVFADEVVGRGLMPHDLESLKKQRWRWAFGNAQILRANWRRIFFGHQLNWRQKLGCLAHLTAWFNFNLIPSLSLVLLAPLAILGLMQPVQPFLVVTSWFTLLTYFLLRFATLFLSLRRDGHGLRDIVLAYFTHIGLGWIFSLSWLKCLWSHREPFLRTNKFLGQQVPGLFTTAFAELCVGMALLLAAVSLALSDFFFGPITALLMSGARFAIVWIERQLRHTLRFTELLLARVRLPRALKWQPKEPEPPFPDEGLEAGSTSAQLAG